MEETKNDDVIRLGDIFHVLWKNIILIAIITAAVFVCGIVYTFAIAKPTYSSESSFMVTLGEDETGVTLTGQPSSGLVSTVARLVTENKVLSPVAEKNNMTVGELKDMITVSSSSNVYIVTVTVECSDADLAKSLNEQVIDSLLAFYAESGAAESYGGAIIVSSPASEGVYTDLKPFEIAVKGKDDVSHSKTATAYGLEKFVGTKGVMPSFNRIGTVWTGGDYRLMTEILREEWGFEGLVISDYKTDNAVMNSRQMLYAGNDLILASLDNLLWTDCDFSSPQDVTILRNSSHNILYVVANSNSMNVDIVGYNTEWWITTLYVVDAVAVVALAVWGVFVIRKNVKKQNASEE